MFFIFQPMLTYLGNKRALVPFIQTGIRPCRRLLALLKHSLRHRITGILAFASAFCQPWRSHQACVYGRAATPTHACTSAKRAEASTTTAAPVSDELARFRTFPELESVDTSRNRARICPGPLPRHLSRSIPRAFYTHTGQHFSIAFSRTRGKHLAAAGPPTVDQKMIACPSGRRVIRNV